MGDERARELSGACTEIDDIGWLLPTSQRTAALRVPRAAALVRAGDVREGGVRPARLRIAVDDHSSESRPVSIRVVSTMRVIRTVVVTLGRLEERRLRS